MVHIRGSYEILTEIPNLVGVKIIRLSGLQTARVGFSLPDSSAIAVFWLIERLRQVFKQMVELDPFALEMKPEHRIQIEEQYLKIIAEIEIVDCGVEQLLLFPVEFLTLCDFAKKKLGRVAEILEVYEVDSGIALKQGYQKVFPLYMQGALIGRTKGEDSGRCRRKHLRQQRKPDDKNPGIFWGNKKEQTCQGRFKGMQLSTHRFWQLGVGMMIFIVIFSVAICLG